MDVNARVAPAQIAPEWFRIMADAAPVMIWMSGADKLSTYFNKPWLEFTGRTLDKELSVGWSEVLHPDDFQRCLTTYTEAFDARRDFEVECRSRRHDGLYRWVLNRGNPIHAADGTFLGYVGSCIDVTERKAAEAQRERLLVESLRDYAISIFWLTPAGEVARWNASAERLNGYRADEILGGHCSRFFPPAEVREGKPDRLLGAAADNGRIEDEGWRVRKDGSTYWAKVIISAVRDDAGLLRGFVTVTRDMTERKRVEEELRFRAAELARVSEEQCEIIDRLRRLRSQRDAEQGQLLLDDERRRIARDLHDHVEQTLFAIGLAAEATLANSRTDQRREIAETLTRVSKLAAAGAERLREAIFALNHAKVVGRGLVPVLWNLTSDFRQRTGIEADIVLTGSQRRLPTEVAETLYAAACEALANVELHSDAAAVILGLHISGQSVTLSIQDDGTGATVPPPERSVNNAACFGLRSVRDRVRDLNGSFVAGPNPDGGFRVRTQLSLQTGASTRNGQH
jgi:PAS domain S-box-containing protein